MNALRILRPGLLTTVQDCGRWGHQAKGVPVSGAMDSFSQRLANLAVGNPRDAATLEVTMIGPHVEFSEAAVFAVCGAEFRLELDDSRVPMNQPVAAGQGSCLKFGERVRGARAYLAVAGGVNVPPVLGSRSTHLVTRMGGLEGRPLRAGDLLPVGAMSTGATRSAASLSGIPAQEGGAKLRVIAAAFMDQIAGRRFTVSSRSDRMGYRLEGSARATDTRAAETISSAVAVGAVQVPPDGQPILLMADHATTGGYPLAATVITADLPVAGQLAPGDWVEFDACSLEEADARLRALEALLTDGPA